MKSGYPPIKSDFFSTFRPIIILVGISLTSLITSFLLGYYISKRQMSFVQPTNNKSYEEKICQMSVDIPMEQYLRVYKVKKGDTLLSISRTQLGTNDRMKEIIQLNNGIHPDLQNYDTSTQIQEGWNLYLPPSFVKSTTGILYAWKAKVLEETEAGWTLYTGSDYAGFRSYSFQKDENTKYFGADSFHAGNCITVLFELANGGYKTIAISPQDKDYFIE